MLRFFYKKGTTNEYFYVIRIRKRNKREKAKKNKKAKEITK